MSHGHGDAADYILCDGTPDGHMSIVIAINEPFPHIEGWRAYKGRPRDNDEYEVTYRPDSTEPGMYAQCHVGYHDKCNERACVCNCHYDRTPVAGWVYPEHARSFTSTPDRAASVRAQYRSAQNA